MITLAKFVTKFQLCLVPILLLLSTRKDKKVLPSLFNCCLNSCHSLSRILLYFLNSSAMVYCTAKKLKWKWCHLFTNSKWPLGKISWERSHAAFPLADIFLLFYSMARTKVTPKKDERGGERWVLCSREARRALVEKGLRPPPQFITHPQPGSPCLQERRRRGRWRRQRSGWRKQEDWRMWEDLCCCHRPDSWPRWLWRLDHLLWVRRSQSGGSSNLLWEAKPPGRNSSRLERSNDQEVLAWHSCSLKDLVVPKEHWAPHQETPLLAVSPWDSPRSGQVWFVLPRECHHMPAGSCRSICGQSHGRCQCLHHTCEKGNNYAQRHSVSPLHLGEHLKY